jgi:hypothetical protein
MEGMREYTGCLKTGQPDIAGGGGIREVILSKNINTTLILYPTVAELRRFLRCVNSKWLVVCSSTDGNIGAGFV